MTICAVLTLCACFSPQEDPGEKALELFATLRLEGSEERELARYRLKQLEPSFAPTLRKMKSFQSDSDVKSSIREALPVLYEEWGKRLYAEGRVEEALTQFAEAAEAPDVKKYVRAKVDDAKGFIRSWLPREHPLGNVLYLSDPYVGLAKSIRGCFGPWGMMAVVEEARACHRGNHYWQILKQMGDDAVPVLCRELRSVDLNCKSRAVLTLSQMAQTTKGPRSTPQWIAAAKAVADDASESESIRKKAREMVEFLRW
jgi:hypothetical protein